MQIYTDDLFICISVFVTLPYTYMYIHIPSLCHPHTGYNNTQEVYCNWRSASPCGNLNVCYVAFQRQTRPDQDHISQIADRRSKRIKRQPQPEIVAASSPVPFPFVCFGAIFSRAAPAAGQVQRAASLAVPDASLQFVQHPLSQSLPISLCLGLCCTLHNCRLLIDRSNNVMDAQPAFDATTPRGNPRCMLLYTYVRASSIGYWLWNGNSCGYGNGYWYGMLCGMLYGCMAVSLCFPPHMVRPGP